jgi:hypothetical protein
MRLSDVLRTRGAPPPGVIDVCGTFGDLLWPPSGGYTRWMGRELAVFEEIEYLGGTSLGTIRIVAASLGE